MIHTMAAAGTRVGSRHRLWSGLILCGLALISDVSASASSRQDEPLSDVPVATLRVQTNVVQIPVLVLDEFREKLHSPVVANRFFIRLGTGPWVRPRYVRLEGEDPINLAIIVDPREQPSDLLPKLSESIAALAPSSLSSRDRVSIYVMGCSVMHVAKNVPVDRDALRSAADTVLRNWKEHAGEESDARCKPSTQLWDTLAYVTQAISDQPGRRTILAVTNGDDQKSKHTADDVGALARLDGVTLFFLEPAAAGPSGRTPEEQSLSATSESTGGIKLNLAGKSVDKELQRFVAMLRERYIMEFSRPDSAQASKVHLEVRVANSNYFIRTASKSVPIADHAAN